MILGISQVKLAGGIGLAIQQVQKYEKGANRMAASRLQQIANILQVPAAFFFEGLPEHQADVRRFLQLIITDEVFGTHTIMMEQSSAIIVR